MPLTVAILIYAAAMTMANLLLAGAVQTWGRGAIAYVSPLNSFFLIGLDLALRDWLHFRLKAWQMLALISVSGLLTYALNPSAGMIAIASATAFTGAALVDWATFARLRGSWLFRANGSNVAGAAVDSLIFPTIAFGALMPEVVLKQFIAKVAGGALWAWVLRTNAGAALQSGAGARRKNHRMNQANRETP